MPNDFIEAWERIKKSSEIQSQKELAELLKLTPSAITDMKKTGRFPKKWAYSIEDRLGLSSEWILSGTGPKRRKRKDDFFDELEEWARETGGSENIQWLKNQIENFFPMFKEWKKRREEGEENKPGFPSSKVA